MLYLGYLFVAWGFTPLQRKSAYSKPQWPGWVFVFDIYAYIQTLIQMHKIKVGNIVEGDPRAPFSIATTLRCRLGRYSIPWIAPLYPWSLPIVLSAKKGSIKYHLLHLWYDLTWDWTPVSWTIGEYTKVG